MVVATGSSERSTEAARDQTRDVGSIVSDAVGADAAKLSIDQLCGGYGQVDVLFVNPGVSEFASLEQVDEVAFDGLLYRLVRGPHFLLKHVEAIMFPADLSPLGWEHASLLHHTTSSASSTDAGAALLDELEPAFDGIDQAFDRVRDTGRGQHGVTDDLGREAVAALRARRLGQVTRLHHPATVGQSRPT